MAGEIKTETLSVSKLGSGLTPELRTEVANLVQATLSQLYAEREHHPVKPGATNQIGDSLAPDFAESERMALNDTIGSLKSELAASKKQVQDACILLNTYKSQLESQNTSYMAKLRQLEQQVFKLTAQEAELKTANVQLRTERDTAVMREQEAVLAKKQLAARTMQLSSELTEMHSEYAIKVAQVNDANYTRKQLEDRLRHTIKENEYWRGYYAASMSAAPQNNANPPPAVYFSVPQMSERRNTAPEVHAGPSKYIPSSQADPNASRGLKRQRTDSAELVDGASSGASPTGFGAFRLRPVQMSPASTAPAFVPPLSPLSHSPQATVPNVQPPVHPHPGPSDIAPVAPPQNEAPSPSQAPPSPTKQPSDPQKPELSIVTSSGASESLPTVPHSPAAHSPIPLHVAKFLQQLFPPSGKGYRECRLCKSRPQGIDSVPILTSADPSEYLAHAEKYHSKVLTLLKAQPVRPS